MGWVTEITSVVSVGFALFSCRSVNGHGTMTFPKSRNVVANEAPEPKSEYTPQALNSKPLLDQWKATGSRTFEMSPSPTYPHNLVESAANAARHGVCGDPGQSEPLGTLKYGQSNDHYPVTATVAGGTIDITVVLTAHHEGHFEFEICDAGPAGTVTQACFQGTPLVRAAGGFATPLATPVDPSYPGRYYIGPSSCNPGWKYTIRYNLPAMTCTHCVLRWHYITANSCYIPGVREFKSNWAACAPSAYGDLSSCGAPPLYPEEFWNCGDFSMSNGGGTPAPAPTTPPATPKPVAPPSATPKPTAKRNSTPKPTVKPTTRPTTGKPTPTPTAGAGTSCSTCNNCYYPPTDACFSGWTKALCDSVPSYTWCGGNPAPVPAPTTTATPQPAAGGAGGCANACNNCYYPPTSACFVGWTKAQCDSVAAYTWCGA